MLSIALTETKRLLIELDGQRRTTFACLTAERMLPNYQSFQTETGWGDVQVLRTALDLAWRSAYGGNVEKATLDRAIGAVGAQAPETEDFSSSFCSAAIDAGETVAGALDCARDGALEEPGSARGEAATRESGRACQAA